MTLKEAFDKGVTRIRRPMWWSGAYLKILTTEDGLLCPTSELFDRAGQSALGQKTPTSVVTILDATNDYEPYDGKLDESEISDPELNER